MFFHCLQGDWSLLISPAMITGKTHGWSVKKARLNSVLFDMCILPREWEIQASICRTRRHAMRFADLPFLYYPLPHLILHYSKAPALHLLFTYVQSRPIALFACDVIRNRRSALSVVEDKGGFSSSFSRWIGMNSTVLLPRTILCAVTYTHVHQWILVWHTHVLVSVNLAE